MLAFKRGVDVVALLLQSAPQRPRHLDLVLEQQDPHAHHLGDHPPPAGAIPHETTVRKVARRVALRA